jgi:hypothetical protein
VWNQQIDLIYLLAQQKKKVLPMPLGVQSRMKSGAAKCIWHEAQLEYAHQVEFALLLRRLAQHFCASTFGLQHSRRFNATKIIVLGAMNALLDVVLRADTRGPDGDKFASPVSLYMAGGADEDDGAGANKPGELGRVHAVGAKLFVIQCGTLCDISVVL